jgi:hypothetical protein
MSTTDMHTATRLAWPATDPEMAGRPHQFVPRFLPRPIKRRLAACRPDLCPAHGANAL